MTARQFLPSAGNRHLFWQVPEWTLYDDEIADLARRTLGGEDVLRGGEQESLQKEEEKKEKEKGKGKVPEHGEL